jgi:carbonic anhydrase/acetyltransferase-like protein (isoleucine patch superfamily)
MFVKGSLFYTFENLSASLGPKVR